MEGLFPVGWMVSGGWVVEGEELGIALLEDEQNFIDHSKSSVFIVREKELGTF